MRRDRPFHHDLLLAGACLVAGAIWLALLAVDRPPWPPPRPAANCCTTVAAP